MSLHSEQCGNGEKVLFIHGAGGNTSVWHYQKEHLKNSSEVVLLDLPGHGHSTGEYCQSIEDYANTVQAAIVENTLQGCYLAGHSMGGMIAMHLALRDPALLKGLILIATGARLKVLPQILEGLAADKEQTVKNIVRYAFSETASPEMRQTGFTEMMKCPADVIYRDFYSCDHFDIMKEVNNIDVPTLIVCGLDDKLTPPKYSEFLAKQTRRSRLVLVPDAGHMVMIEKPEDTNQAIENFLSQK